jgi:hypothetical protein
LPFGAKRIISSFKLLETRSQAQGDKKRGFERFQA